MADKLVSVNDDYDFPALVAARQAEKVAAQLAPKLDKVTADSTYAPLASLPQTVRHGGEASAARTTTGQITWVGWVQPANMEAQDVWLEIGQPAFNIKTSIDWEALYLASDLTVAEGAPVPMWADASGHGHNLTPATSIGAGTPTLKSAATEFNGKPAVAFNASAMWSEVLSQPVSQPFTVIAVARGLTNPTGIFGGPAIIYRASAAPGHYAFNPGNGAREITGSAGADLKLLMVEFDGNTSTGRANALTAIAGTPSGTVAHQATQIKIGGHDAGASKQSEIAMVGMYRGKLTTKQRTDLFAWVTAQYGITL